MAAVDNPASLTGRARALVRAEPHLCTVPALMARLRQTTLPVPGARSLHTAAYRALHGNPGRPAGAPKTAPPAPALRPATVQEEVQGDRTIRKLQGQVRDLKKKYDHAVAELDLSDRRYEVLANIKEPTAPLAIAEGHPGQGEATAVALYSDWHLEERVDLHQMNGLNEYNPDIAEARARCCFQNTLRLVQKERAAVRIDELLVWLGGDFITGYIHEELSQTNYLSPTEATRFAKRLLIAGLEFLLIHGKFTRLRVPCNPGNHGRTTGKMQLSNSYKMSYEWMMYQDLRDYFRDEPRLVFDIPESPFAYVRVYDKTLRGFHGEAVKYGGGIGGVAIPLLKYVGRIDQQRPADYNVLGHFHQFIQPAKNICMNGSLIGFSPYAQKIGCTPEPPQQGFLLLDKLRGQTVRCPIHVQ
ncbi:MAG: hypothetical protein NVS3B25_33610 [Hymenobacter sp.]